jgi:hypothetical protein
MVARSIDSFFSFLEGKKKKSERFHTLLAW